MKHYNWFFILLCTINLYSQSNFNLVGNEKKMSLKFKLINNLILIPIELNQNKFTFILDTGVSKSLLFNVKSTDSLKLKNLETVRIRGLGEMEYFNATISKRNFCRINKLISLNFEIFLIQGEQFDFSARLGENVHGLIGYDLLKNFVVEINYQKKLLTFTKKEFYKYKKCRKCVRFPIVFQKDKPYIDSYISDEKSNKIPVKLLIDSGSSDALWLFENNNIKVPNKFFEDYLGSGLSGEIHGKKALQNQFEMKRFIMKDVLVSFPDLQYIKASNTNIDRNGIVGSEILSRFHIILDYPNKQISLRKNKKFKEPFYYNRSGLDIIYNGKILVKSVKNTFYGNEKSNSNDYNSSNAISISYVYNYEFKNSYIINSVKENSPANQIGLKAGDIILSINHKPSYFYDLKEIIQELSNKKRKNINLKIMRNGFEYTFTFDLVDLL